MILRHLVQRAGRGAFSTPRRFTTWQRFQSAETDSIQASIHNSLKETHSIEAQFNALSPQPVQPIDSDTHATAEPDSVARDYYALHHQRELIGSLGSTIAPHYQPHTLVTNPPSPADVTLELLLASQSHLGHATSLWNPANSQYIFGVRDGIHIISLDVTAAYLRRAARVITGVAQRGGLILFAGTRPGQDRCVVKAAELAGGCHLFERWIPGSITNGQQILGRCKLKVVDEFDQDVEGFEEQLIDRPSLKPDLVVCLNPLENYVLLHECALNNVPTVGIIDTDANPTWVTYPIPANDDSLRCVQVIAGVLGRAAEAGKKERLQAAQSGDLTFTPAANLVIPSGEDGKKATFEILEDARDQENSINKIYLDSLTDNVVVEGLGAEEEEEASSEALLEGSNGESEAVSFDQDEYQGVGDRISAAEPNASLQEITAEDSAVEEEEEKEKPV